MIFSRSRLSGTWSDYRTAKRHSGPDKQSGLVLAFAAIFIAATAACQRAPAPDQDRAAIQQLLDTYFRSVNTADVNLASQIWLQSPDLVVITPMGRFQGWDSIRDDVYGKFLKNSFLERDLRPSNVVIHTNGNSGWAAYNWDFTAKLASGQPMTSKGWESQVYQKTDQGWRIVHLHYSGVPAPFTPPSASQ